MTGVTLSAVLAGSRFDLGGAIGACWVAEQYRHDHKECRGAQADGVDHHDVRKGAEVREHAEYPVEADAADTDMVMRAGMSEMPKPRR